MIKQVSRDPKRLEGELKYDYCCRRLLDKYRVAIIKLGRTFYSSRTPYRKEAGVTAKMSKKQKKQFRRAKTKYKLRVNAMAS